APDTVRGLFRPIDTNVPGVRISELMPALARRADKLAIVRTLHHSHAAHNSGMYWSIVGRPYRIDSTLINPSRADHPSFGTLVGRRDLLARVDAQQPIRPHGLDDLAVNRATAFEMVQSETMRRAFDLSREPDRVRDRYGRHSWGQSHLLARRLIEAGVRFVTTVNGPSIIWDTHADNFNRLKNRLVPPMERAFVALLDDLEARGLLESTLVIWMGDFGRTPIINKDAGRDHWPGCYSVVLAGGGIRGGQVYGESDRTGAAPKSFPVTPADLHATVFTALGYDPH